MKKITILAAIAAASLAVFSCAQVEQDVLTNDGVFVLSLDSGEMETRAVDTNFETAIDHFDYFFFSDAEGTTPIEGMHGRATGSSKVLDTQVGAEFEALRSITSYVYVLANYPTALDHTHDWELDDILALDVTSPIATAVDGETGAVTFTDNLVMDSWRVEGTDDVYTVELTPTKIQEERDVTVPLARLAAKINVHITVEPSVTIGDYEWNSRPELLKGYFVNALNNKSTVAGTPVKRSEIPAASVDDYQYLTYPTNYPLAPAPAVDVYEYDLDPVYTYPQEWTSNDNGEPYFKFQMPWINERPDTDDGPSMGSSNFYYKVTVPKPDSGSWTLKRNTCYEVYLTLSMLNPQDDYIEVEYGITVVPWADSGRPGGSGLSAARFFEVPTKVFELYNEETLDIPFSSSSAVKAFFTEVKFQYFGTNAGATYTFSYTEADNKTDFTLPTKDSDNQTVAAAARDTHPYAVVVSGKNVHFTHGLTDIFTVREIKVKIKDERGNEAEVLIRQHPAIEIKKHPTMNAFVNGWFGHVQNPMDAEGNPFAQNSYNIYTDKYGNTVSKVSKGKGVTASYIETSPYFNVFGYYGALASNQNTFITEPYLTEVVVTAFSSTNHTYKIRYGEDPGSSDHDLVNPGPTVDRSYTIGDPRVKASAAGKDAGWLQSGYLYKETYSGNDYTEDIRPWITPEEIMIGSTSVNARTFVAPRFLLASTLNVTNGVGFATAQRRAAVYQEEGYPAGRWRLPTEAEICFIIDRQNDKSLPQLLRANQWYWSADGNVIYTGSGATTIPGSAPRPTKSAPLRFIYDLWYWGDADPDLATNVYHPNMHLVAPNPTTEP